MRTMGNKKPDNQEKKNLGVSVTFSYGPAKSGKDSSAPVSSVKRSDESTSSSPKSPSFKSSNDDESASEVSSNDSYVDPYTSDSDSSVSSVPEILSLKSSDDDDDDVSSVSLGTFSVQSFDYETVLDDDICGGDNIEENSTREKFCKNWFKNEKYPWIHTYLTDYYKDIENRKGKAFNGFYARKHNDLKKVLGENYKIFTQEVIQTKLNELDDEIEKIKYHKGTEANLVGGRGFFPAISMGFLTILVASFVGSSS